MSVVFCGLFGMDDMVVMRLDGRLFGGGFCGIFDRMFNKLRLSHLIRSLIKRRRLFCKLQLLEVLTRIVCDDFFPFGGGGWIVLSRITLHYKWAIFLRGNFQPAGQVWLFRLSTVGFPTSELERLTWSVVPALRVAFVMARYGRVCVGILQGWC